MGDDDGHMVQAPNPDHPGTMKPHPHAENARLYAEDMAETDRAWERWEMRPPSRVWLNCVGHPIWAIDIQYRRKPRTININGFNVPEPMRHAPPLASRYWVVDLTVRGGIESYI